MSLSKINLPGRYNYIACFLTLDCNFRCSYCINSQGSASPTERRLITGKDWVRGLNRIACSTDLPVTLQGGEPSLHPDFIWIIKHIKKNLDIDILTNLSFNVDEFMDKVDPARLNRGALYPNIRVSYHPPHMDLNATIKKVAKMSSAGFSIGIFAVLYPGSEKKLSEARKRCLEQGVDFRTKEFLGVSGGKVYGSYFYPQAVYNPRKRICLCRTSELVLDPSGNAFRCHRDLYRGCPSIGNLLESDFKVKDAFKSCSNFGDCNPCDIKTKTNRFQVFGHHAVEIKEIGK